MLIPIGENSSFDEGLCEIEKWIEFKNDITNQRLNDEYTKYYLKKAIEYWDKYKNPNKDEETFNKIVNYLGNGDKFKYEFFLRYFIIISWLQSDAEDTHLEDIFDDDLWVMNNDSPEKSDEIPEYVDGHAWFIQSKYAWSLDDPSKIPDYNIFILANHTGEFAINTYMNALFNGITIKGFPSGNTSFDGMDNQSPEEFITHDCNHEQMIDFTINEYVNDSEYYHNILLDTSLNKIDKEILTFAYWFYMHELTVSPKHGNGIYEYIKSESFETDWKTMKIIYSNNNYQWVVDLFKSLYNNSSLDSKLQILRETINMDDVSFNESNILEEPYISHITICLCLNKLCIYLNSPHLSI